MTNSPETTISLDDRIEEARELAHQAGEKFGKTSPEFAVAMETLEELHQEASHQRNVTFLDRIDQWQVAMLLAIFILRVLITGNSIEDV